MKKGGGSESTIIVGPSKSVLVYALHSLEYVLGLARFRVFVPNLFAGVWHLSLSKRLFFMITLFRLRLRQFYVQSVVSMQCVGFLSVFQLDLDVSGN